MVELGNKNHALDDKKLYAVAKRPRDASCLYSFNTKRRAQSFIIGCFGFIYTTAYNTRMIGLPYGEKKTDDTLSRFHPIPQRNGRTDRRTDLLYQYRASVC